MDGCPNAEEAAAPASSLMPGEFFLGEIAEGGDDVNLEWLSMFVEDCLSSSSYPNKLLNPPPLSSSKPQNQAKPSTTHPSKARSKRARNSVMRDPPPLLHQTHWLAESELIIFPKSIPADEEVKEQGSRRCSHCLSQRTPQWRAGPMGPKTLCNACGVRFKSGRLLPEYRPAKSPTFVSDKHSNSHKKVMEMRMDLSPSHHPK